MSYWSWWISVFPGGENGIVAVLLVTFIVGTFWPLKEKDYAGPASLVAGLAVMGVLNIMGIVSALMNVIILCLARLAGLVMYRGSRDRSRPYRPCLK